VSWRSFLGLPERADPTIGLNEWAGLFSYQGLAYPFLRLNQTGVGERLEQPHHSYGGFATGVYQRNSVVFSAMATRQDLFSEARFKFRQQRDGRPGQLFGNTDLRRLENPWPGATTGDLLARTMLDVDLAGNSYWVPWERNTMKRLRPDWVSIIIGSLTDESITAEDLGAEVVGYVYQPGGPGSGKDEIVFLAAEVAHFAPRPDPMAYYRGMSWLTPLVREIMADSGLTDHKIGVIEKGGTNNMVVKPPPELTPEKFDLWVKKFKELHPEGAANYGRLFMGGGSDVTVVGMDWRQMDLRNIQGGLETRIASASQVPAVILGISEGLEGSSLNEGNFEAAQRLFADRTLRPLWRNLCGSLAKIITVPGGAELWYDDRDIPFLQADASDDAEIQSTQAQTIRTLIEAGYDPDAVLDAIVAGDLSRLSGKHSGMLSVQLQEPGAQNENGNGNGVVPAVVVP
jgi:hypothetical protein